PVVIISGHGNIETAVSAIKRGAYDYLEKPFKVDRLVLVTERALENSRLKRENDALRGRTGGTNELVGSSAIIRQLKQTIEKIAPTNSRVLISGPHGSGKELAARLLHEHSLRCNGPFVTLSAATMTPDRMEEEFFGTEDPQSGKTQRIGALEEAHQGTLYIDEVADMPLETQAKILRVLVAQRFQRVGGSNKVKVDVRVVSSSSKNLQKMIEDGEFREDLFHRLNVVPLVVPGLPEHAEDIPELIAFFAKQYSQSSGQPARKIGDDVVAILQTHDWPGNVRQLRNNVERLLILAEGDSGSEISKDMLPSEVGDSVPGSNLNGSHSEEILNLTLREAREVFERDFISAQLMRFGGNISKTSNHVGMERSALHRKIKSLGLHNE
ncbi:MAG TPA: sigma-54-dependent Fis family transcriptional regulator, partial [Rhizobiales bacterium]|nr:sigma-54-dependent Fis family transcriptional regulator [Hyphomicrobiales bacterium]